MCRNKVHIKDGCIRLIRLEQLYHLILLRYIAMTSTLKTSGMFKNSAHFNIFLNMTLIKRSLNINSFTF